MRTMQLDSESYGLRARLVQASHWTEHLVQHLSLILCGSYRVEPLRSVAKLQPASRFFPPVSLSRMASFCQASSAEAAFVEITPTVAASFPR
jgi:hypothetical protein